LNDIVILNDAGNANIHLYWNSILWFIGITYVLYYFIYWKLYILYYIYLGP
jgi:hypothetical protein